LEGGSSATTFGKEVGSNANVVVGGGGLDMCEVDDS